MRFEHKDLDALLERKEELQQEAIALGRRLIRAELRKLNARFHRHRFSFIDGMGTSNVEIEPRVGGEWIVDHLRIYPGPVRDYLNEVDSLIREGISETIGDEFRVDFGIVTADNEDED